MKVDPKTELYPTSVTVDRGGIEAFVTSSDPRSFPVVLLLTESTYRPANFSFMVRDALSQVGITRVYSAREFRAMADDRKFVVGDKLDSEVIKRYSAAIEPILVVSAAYIGAGDANTVTSLSVQDGRTGQMLLKLDHPKMVWWSFDTEALYPVLNELRKWVKASTPGAV